MWGLRISVLCALVALNSVPTQAPSSPPRSLDLSSWTSIVADGEIVGGTMTVTISNPSPRALSSVAFDLSSVPCSCAITSFTATAGFLDADVWTIARIAAGSTETLQVSYGHTEPASLRASIPRVSSPDRRRGI
jgi:hypothetical protein